MSGENILKGCLVESDPEKVARARQAKRRALIVAIILQILLVGLLVLAPLLGAVEKLPARFDFTPVPPYKGVPKEIGPKREKAQGPRKPLVTSNKPPVYQPRSIPKDVADVVDPPEVIAGQAETSRGSNIIGDPNGKIDLDAPGEKRAAAPKAEEEVTAKPKGPVRVSSLVQEARLVYRVEPKYPPMPRSAGIEGRVVLRAVIARDGTVQSLEVVSGSPLFILAAREAIAQWRYQPTLLNGEAVEVETVITVVFTLRR